MTEFWPGARPDRPYLRADISRFGAYATDDLRHQPDPFAPLLKEVDFTAVDLAA